MGTITLYFKMKIKEEINKMIRDLTIIRKTQNKRTGDLTREKEKFGNSNQKFKCAGRSQDGGGIGRGDHFLFYKFIERTTER